MLILKPLSIDWSVAGANIPAVTFIVQAGLTTRELAHMLDSLVRVSRRVEENHLVIVVEYGMAEAVTATPTTLDRTRVFNSEMSSTTHVHLSEDKLPFTKSFPHLQIDVDTQGKNHHPRPDQNLAKHLR